MIMRSKVNKYKTFEIIRLKTTENEIMENKMKIDKNFFNDVIKYQ